MLRSAAARLSAALALVLAAAPALAQGGPAGGGPGPSPAPNPWILSGTYMYPVNGTRVVTAASKAQFAGFNLPQGAAPSSPVNGDVWTTAAGLYVQINGATVGPLAAATTAGFAANAPVQLAFPSGVVTYGLGYDGNFTVVAGNLALTPVGSGYLLANSGASGAEPTGVSWTSFADRAIGSTNGMLPYRAGGAWSTIQTGTSGATIPLNSTANVFSSPQTVNLNASSAPAPPAGATLQLAQADGTVNRIVLDAFGSAATFTGRVAGGTRGSPSAVTAGTTLAQVGGWGYGATGYSTGSRGSVAVQAAGTWTDASQPTQIIWTVTPAGSTSGVAAAEMFSTGGVNLGAPTGGDLGGGYLNVSGGLAVNGVAVSAGSVVNSATVNQIAYYASSGTAVSGLAPANGTVPNTGSGGALVNTANPVLGVNGSYGGSVTFFGSSSGAVTISPQAAAGASVQITLPNTSGTVAASAAAPITLNATTGAVACATCVTSSGGGAITGAPPVAVSAAGAVSITGAAGGVLAGAGPAFTNAPTLGVAGSSVGSIAFANLTSGSVTVQPATGALGSSVVTIPAITDTLAGRALANGGTNASLTASNGGVVYSTASALAILSGTATANLPLLSGSGAAPAWAAIGYPTSATSGGVPYFSSATSMASSAALGAGQIVVGGGAGAAPTTSANASLSAGALTLGQAGSAAGSIVLGGGSSGTATIQVAAAAGAGTIFQLPPNNGTSGYVLQTNGGGVTSWQPGGAGTVTSFVCGSTTITTTGTCYQSGQVVGTPTNDNATAGNFGEYRVAGSGKQVGGATVTITIASPAVVTWTGHPYQSDGAAKGAAPIVFATTGALPTGITAGTTYYVALPPLSANTFNIATSVDNAIAGTYVNTSGSQSGTQSATSQSGNLSNATTTDVAGLQLTAGDWDVGMTSGFGGDPAASTTAVVASLNTASATLNQTPGFFVKFPAFSAPFASSGQIIMNSNGMGRLSLSGTATVYLSAFAAFSGGNVQSVNDAIIARRRR